MSIYNRHPVMGGSVSNELSDALRRNGMNAHLTTEQGKPVLVVQSHDSHVLSYPLNNEQYYSLINGGCNSANRRAYNTFVNIVKNDFDCPKDWIHASNAFGRVRMGLHGYRADRPFHAVSNGFHSFQHSGYVAWGVIPQGFHGRRYGMEPIPGRAPIIPVRENNYIKPGELESGSYGFYYKGNNAKPLQVSEDLMNELANIKIEHPMPERSSEPAIRYSDSITSEIYFTNEKWNEILSSHGIVLDEEKKTLTIQSQSANFDTVYDLNDAQMAILTANKLDEGHSIDDRLKVINDLIQNDYEGSVNMDLLNSMDKISVTPIQKDEVERIVSEMQQDQRDNQVHYDPLRPQSGLDMRDTNVAASVDGAMLSDLNDSKGWYREGEHGRSVSVGSIWVEKDETSQKDVQYKMSAVINGQVVSHEIKEKDFNKFIVQDDYHRMKLFSQAFNEVDMKTIPGRGINFLDVVGATLGMVHGITNEAVHVAHGIAEIKNSRMQPDFYANRFVPDREPVRGGVFFKPGVDSPQDIAQRAFEAGVMADRISAAGIKR